MHVEVRRIRRFINKALRLAHEEIKTIVPDFYDFKKKLKENVSDVHLSTNEKGSRMITLSMGKGGRVKVEIIAEGVEEEEARQKLKGIMLDSFSGKIN